MVFPLRVSHLSSRKDRSALPLLRCWGLLDDTASPGHMLLYIPIRITLLWNVRKCVVLASASSMAPWPHPQHRPGDTSSSGALCQELSAALTEGPPHSSLSPLETSLSGQGFKPLAGAPKPLCGQLSRTTPPLARLVRRGHIPQRFLPKSALTFEFLPP